MGSQEERIIRLIANTYNRAVLSILNDAARPLPVTELADRLVSHDAGVLRSSDYENEFDRTLVALHHKHLPQLDDAGLITYDHEENVAVYRDYAAVDAEWMEIELIDELLSRFQTGSRSDGDAIGVIEGQADVYEYSRELADKAEDELFLVYASDDLLDQDCLPHARRAIERGVDIYAGSQNPDVREYFREFLPAATIWEPQGDWMNEPSRYPRVGRLIVADRDKVMVALWDEPGDDGTRSETAMIGEGATNPLVALVRGLLGPRLDHLDYQSDDFTSDLPFEP
ncbi:ArsR family transcriptional regulator [Natribaculum luteum]|uniref:ArsR family transcriptional regulator n=1 Tax=Natribaculum luteum TaxID=1586232 RepID=A0ABD5P4M3_9EURY|nr:ArsR family transcriptional regulator [Natribaculum luteum]